MADNFVKRSEFGAFDLGGGQAPAGYNPDQIGRMTPPPVGEHEMEIIDFGVTEQPVAFRWDGGTFYHHKLQVFLQVRKGAHTGTGLADYLPMPSKDAPFTCVGLANRFGQFLKALGFQMPAGKCVPDGFDLKQILGRSAIVSLKHNEDENNAPKYKEGLPDINVRLFGYRPVGSHPPTGSKPPAGPKQSTKPPTSKPAADVSKYDI